MGKQHSDEYKEYVAKLVVEEGRKASELAYELELASSTIRRWVKKYRDQTQREKSGEKFYTPSEIEKMKRTHEKEMQSLKEENEILKKAMHIFSKSQQ